MSIEIDCRDHSINKLTPEREQELNALASAISGQFSGAQRIRIKQFDALTGNPSSVSCEHAPARTSNYVQRACDHLHSINRALGLVPTQPVEFVPDPHYQTTSSGAICVHIQQCHNRIPIFGAVEAVRFTPSGALQDTTGRSVTVNQQPELSPTLTVQEAVLLAAQHVVTPDTGEHQATDQFGQTFQAPQVDLSGFEAIIITSFPETPEAKTVLEAEPFADVIKARLLWFPFNDALRLSWEVLLTMPEYSGQYRTLVDAETGEILYCHQQMNFITARGNVFQIDGSNPRVMTDFPRPLTELGLPIPDDLPNGFPEDWVSVDSTEGNSTDAHLGSNGPSSQGTLQAGVLTFNPANSAGDDQKVLNIFYYNGVMHDYFYLLGFREADGNFQQDNLGRGGLANDRVDARAHSGAVDGTANMSTPMDGSNPVMNMGLVTSTDRHTAFDSSVVYHEFSHGVTNRLVGGPADAFALEESQSGGMGEGWSDYFACTINDTIVVGDWVVNDPGGIRDFPYDSNFPDNFGDLGTGRYRGFTVDGDRAPHAIGEIWCATLLEMNRNIGADLGAQLVVDGLKLTAANPSFLDARNAILAALDDMLAAGQLNAGQHETTLNGIWQAFARFGMGPNAQSNGPFLTGIVADFNTPEPEQPESEADSDVQLEVTPNLAIPDNQLGGISSVLTVDQTGRITRLTVSVNIQHTFIGDLRVSLTSPSGNTVLLHNRNGGGTNNLLATYTSDDVAGLAVFLDDLAQGDWRLRVEDLAGADVGTLNQWGLGMDLEEAGDAIEREITPFIAIPDKNPNGIGSTITIAQSGATQSLRVSIDITHTYIGDLRVLLVAPSGQQALLHNQTGGSADNLTASFDANTNPALANLLGQEVQGEWQLRVADLVGQDIGTLNRWRLEIDLGTGSVSQPPVQGQALSVISIPDNDPNGISSTIDIAQFGTTQRLQVNIDITHTYIGDLRVVLIAPSGQQALLHDQLGDSADNLIVSFDSNTNPALANLLGQEIQGEWELRVADLVGQDVGKLNRWSMELARS